MSSYDGKAKKIESGQEDLIEELVENTIDEKEADGVKGGKGTSNDLSFVHKIDKASPVFMQSAPPPKPSV